MSKKISELDVSPGLTPAALFEVEQAGASYKNSVQDALDLIVIANVGAGATIFRDETPTNTFNLKSIIGGTNVTVDNNANDITINSTGGGATTLPALTDVTITTRAANEVLVVNAGNTLWVNALLVDANISGSAAIAYSKLALTGAVLNADLAGSITLTKLENLLSSQIIVGSVGNVPTAVAMSGDATITNAGVVTVSLAATVTTNANLTGGVTSIGNAATVITNANLTGGVTSVGNAATVITNANLTGDVTSVGNATTIAAGSVDIAMLSATGTPDATTFLRGDNTWAVPAGSSLPVADTTSIVEGSVDATKELRFEVDGNTTGIIGVLATTFTTAKTITFPDATGNVVVTGLADQLTNTELTAGAFAKITGVGVLTTGTWNAVDIVFANLQQILTDRLVGRDTAATGDMEELTVAGGVEFTGAGGIQSSAYTGDVTKAAGGTVTTIAVDAVDIAMLSATGVADATTFLRGDNTWAAPAGSGDMVLATAQTSTGKKSFTTDATNAGLAILPLTGDPSALVNGDVWIDDTGTDVLKFRTTGVTRTITDNVNRQTAIVNSEIDGAAAIAFSKLAALTSGNVLVGSAGNVVTSVTMSGDVFIIASGATTIQNNTVTLAKMADIATASFIGRVTAATGDPEVLTGTQATTLLNVFTSALKGLVPASGGSATEFLSADGTFKVPAGGGDMVLADVQTVTGAKTFGTIGGVVGKFILAGSTSGSTIVNAAAVAGATTITFPGTTGTVVITGLADQLTNTEITAGAYAKITGVGTLTTGVWNATDIALANIVDIATASFLGRTTAATGVIEVLTATQATAMLNVFTSTLKGLVPLSGGSATEFLSADGTFKVPAGGGDMVLADVQTVTGAKTFGGVAAVGKFILAGNTSGTTIVNAAAVAGATTITFPGTTGTVVIIGLADQINNTEITAGAYAKITGVGTLTTGTWNATDIVFANIQQIATDRILGRDTAATGDIEELTLNATLEFSGAGAIQRAALSGDVTAPAGSNTTTVANVPVGALPSTVVLNDQANTYTAGSRQNFLGLLAGTAGLNVGGIAGNPTTQVDGDIWLNTSTNQLFGRVNGANVDLGASGGEVFTWTANHDADGFALEAPVFADATTPSKTLTIDLVGMTAAINGTLDFNFTTAKTITFPDATGDVVLETVANVFTQSQAISRTGTAALLTLKRDEAGTTQAGVITFQQQDDVSLQTPVTIMGRLATNENPTSDGLLVISIMENGTAATEYSRYDGANARIRNAKPVLDDALFTVDIAHTIIKAGQWNTSTLGARLGADFDADSVEATVYIEGNQLNATDPVTGYQKNGLFVQVLTADPTVNETHGVVAIDSRAMIATGNATGEVWGLIGRGETESGTADGLVHCIQAQLENESTTDQAAVATKTSKYGVSIRNQGTQNGTAALWIVANAPPTWHIGIYCDPTSITASTGFFINYLNQFDIAQNGDISIYGNKLFVDAGVDTSIRESATGVITFEAGATDTLNVGSGYISIGASPADAGTIRLSNLATIQFEAAPAGTNGIFTFTATENFEFQNGDLFVEKTDALVAFATNYAATAPADSVVIGDYEFRSDTDTTASQRFATIRCTTGDVTHATSSGIMALRVRDDSVVNDYVVLDGEAQTVTIRPSNVIGLTVNVGATDATEVNIVVGASNALLEAATDGFLHIPIITAGAGTPTGTPTTFTGKTPIVYDDVNNILYAWNGAAWANVASGGAEVFTWTGDHSAGSNDLTTAKNVLLTADTTHLIDLTRTTAQADDYVIGEIRFRHPDAGAVLENYARITGEMDNDDVGDENGALHIYVTSQGVHDVEFMSFNEGGLDEIRPKKSMLMGTQQIIFNATGQNIHDKSGDNGSTEYEVETGKQHIFQVAAVDKLIVEGLKTTSAVPLFILEQAAAAADVLTFGQIWVIDTAPNALMFTDDTGIDSNLTRGVHDIPIGAQSMFLPTLEPATGLTNINFATNDLDFKVYEFTSSTADERVQFTLDSLPRNIDLSDIDIELSYSFASGSGVVRWAIRAVGMGDNDSLDPTWGATIAVNDTAGTANQLNRVSLTAMAVGASPAEGDTIQFEVFRNGLDAGDTFTGTARLHGITLRVRSLRASAAT